MQALIANWEVIEPLINVAGGAQGLQLSNVQLLAPIPRPAGTIMCVGKNYLDHVKEVDSASTMTNITASGAPAAPIIFTKAAGSVVGPDMPIVYPAGVSEEVDYEGELAVVIGKGGRNIPRGEALKHVFGYTVANDVTARDLQRKHQQWFIGKSLDGFCPMGPWLVPAAYVDGTDLAITCSVNGEVRQSGRTSMMIFPVDELIATISAGITLHQGDIILTGTPAGVGSSFKPPKFLRPGDVVRVEVEGVGCLENTVVGATAASL
mmetsp:Transcript_16075/g.50530  ORF Transcript_16075/g.50530 Transcript_16075/m.50530 type:complete len:264 (+) Transcript_16075:328-1119(+)